MPGEFVEWIGLGPFKDAITKLVTHADDTMRSAVAEGAHLIEAEAKNQFAGSHKRGEPHVGGSKPNVVTGALRRSIHVVGPVRMGMGWEAEVGPSIVYARAIELGLRQAPSIKYPYFAPGVREAMPKVRALFVERSRRLFGGGL